MKAKKLLYQGSVKNVYDGKESASLFFEFSDRYSVFDWGEMPDSLKNKGKSLTILGKSFFEIFENKEIWNESIIDLENDHLLRKHPLFLDIIDHGLRTHYINCTDNQFLEVEKVSIIKPALIGGKYNYDSYKKRQGPSLIPLEVVFRFGAPEGSSYLKRHPELSPGCLFNQVEVDFFTKLEPQDRFLSEEEAIRIAGLNYLEFSDLKALTKIIAYQLKNIFSQINLELWDGKLEFAWDQNHQLMLVDSIGPDELRLVYNGHQLSKEYLRQYYLSSNWYKSLIANKINHPDDFKQEMIKKNQTPNPLPHNIKYKAESIYQHLANEINYISERRRPFQLDEKFEDFLNQLGSA